MALTVVQTTEEQLIDACVLRALREGVETCGSVVLLVPSFAQALDAQRRLANEQGLALSITTTTPSAWVKERWEVWGDGRRIADATVLTVLAREAICVATPDERGPIRLSSGVVDVLGSLVAQAMPWLPLDAQGQPIAQRCAAAGLTETETRLMGLAGKTNALLEQWGFVSASEATVLVPELLHAAEAHLPAIVVAGFSSMRRSERELVKAMAALTQETLVVPVCTGPAFEQVRGLVSQLGVSTDEVLEAHADSAEALVRPPELISLLDKLFAGDEEPVTSTGAVELLLPAGPVAEAELVARRVEQLVRDDAAHEVVVAVPDVARARREFVPKLAARGIPVRVSWSTPLLDCPATQAFFAFAHAVALLVELDATWPAPVEGLEGPVAQLGDMSWWPPRDLSDFLLSDISHVGANRAWWDDALWRGNRLLSPAQLLAALQSEKDTSASVAQATAELLRGRIGSAASRLLLPYVAEPGAGGIAPGEGTDEARAALQAILQLAGSLRELGVTADPALEGSVTLSELVELAEWAAQGMSIVSRSDVCSNGEVPPVLLMGVGAASRLAPGSVDSLVVCGLTTAEQPVGSGDDLLQALLEQLEVEPKADPMAKARNDFRTLIASVRHHLVLERATHDSDSKVTYPAVMLAELLSAYGIPASAQTTDIALPVRVWSETLLASNVSASGEGSGVGIVCDPAPSGQLTELARKLVFVPQDGSEMLPGDKPVLSASQIETYLDCPYKWFSLRRLRLGNVDAGHGGMEMGTFAHRVLEVTHRELLARSLEVQNPGMTREELLAQIEANPVCHVPGSRVDETNLEAARVALDLEFDLHQQHMYMIRRPRLDQQLLVAHDSFERAQEDQLRSDLLSSLAYQTGILQGFEPRLFEWRFGGHKSRVEYAGAYFTGTVDRIDVSPHGTAVIIDYKHKNPAGFAAEYDALQEGVVEGDKLPNRVQSLIYAQVARRAFEGRLKLVGSVYLSTKSPHALAGVADENVVDLVFGQVSSRRMPRVSVSRTPDGESGMNALLDHTEELVAEQVQQMLAGNVEARPRDSHSCDFCPVMQCERRVTR